MRTRAVLTTLLLAFLVGCQAAPTPAATSTLSGAPTSTPVPPTATTRPKVTLQPIPGGPVLLRDDITLRRVLLRGGGDIRIAQSPRDGAVYVLNPARGLFKINLTTAGDAVLVATVTDMFNDGQPSGMAFGPDGALYVVANAVVNLNTTQAIVRRGLQAGSGRFVWSTVAVTEPYPLSHTPFDHLFNGIVVSPDGKWLYLNSGSRTDHGEVESNQGAFPDMREVPLTSGIFRLPADSSNLLIPNDSTRLQAAGLVFARGTRNSYDPAFAPNGELFAGDNGPDADYPDELNWLREGRHYGFPWRFGNEDNQQRFADYDPTSDPRLHDDFTAVKIGAYHKDPSFPPPPGLFTDPVQNFGPDAVKYRGRLADERDAAAEGGSLYSFTPHRSPLGLVFITDPAMPADLQAQPGGLSAFIMSWGAAGGTLSDRGQDLLHLALTPAGDGYSMTSTQVATDFKNPIDTIMVGNRLYVLEFGDGGSIWELTFK